MFYFRTERHAVYTKFRDAAPGCARETKASPACAEQTDARRSVSRVLCPGLPRGDGHSSRTRLAARLKQPTRTAARKHALLPRREARRPYSVLLPVRFSVPCPSLGARCALTAPFHPCRRARKRAGGLFSVALSLGSPPPGVTRHRVSVEPGLSSPSAFTRWPRPSDRLASKQTWAG